MRNGSKSRLLPAPWPPPSPRGPAPRLSSKGPRPGPWVWSPPSEVIVSLEGMQWEGLADPASPWVRGLHFLIIALSVTASVVVAISAFWGIARGMGTFFHQEPCPEGWMYSRRKCFFFSEVQKSWRSSQDYCLSHGATLAVLTNEDLQNFIASRMGSPAFWIGLRKTGDGLTWVNGDTETGEINNEKRLDVIAVTDSRPPSVADPNIYLAKQPEERVARAARDGWKGNRVEASAEGYCAYIQSTTISLSGCHDPRNWICIKEPYR